MPFDFYKVADYQSLWTAYNERLGAINGSDPVDTVDIDDTFPLSSDWTNHSLLNIADLQNRTRALLTDPATDWRFWITDGTVVDGTTDPRSFGLTFADILPGGWRRKYHKEYRSAYDPDTYYPSANGTPVDGDVARDLTDGKVYERVTGAWVLTTGEPDLVEVAGEFEYCLIGDIAGEWLVEDIKTFLNALTTIFSVGNYFDWIDNRGYGTGTFSDAVFATAKANADANWATGTRTSGNYIEPWSFSRTNRADDGFGGFIYSVDYTVEDGKLTTRTLTTNAAWVVTFYGKAVLSEEANNTFDGQGTGLADGTWETWAGAGTTTATSATSARLGDAYTAPATTTPTTNAGYAKGWRLVAYGWLEVYTMTMF